ncbi:MAG: hypothetical protein SH819_11865 [Cytophagales bacterium]|nr:hypothetical protein [Cytophagales bacterium]
MKQTLAFIFLLLGTQVVACDCKSLTLQNQQDLGFKESPLIFIGDVIEFDSNAGTYKLQIVELFKGKSDANIIVGKYLTSCSGFPKNGRWIIYAGTFENGILDFSSCGLSRSFHEPHFANAIEYRLPPPMKTEYTDSKKSIKTCIELERAIAKLQKQALYDLELEIDQLRKSR